MRLRKPPPDDESVKDDASHDDEADDDAGDDAQRVVQRAGASPDLKATLQNTAVDEVYSALTQAWERDHIRDLANRLLIYLGPPPDLTIPAGLRRPAAQPSQN